MAREGLLNLPFHIDLPISRGSESVRGLYFRPIEQPRPKGLGGRDRALYGRAWVLQEQLLSPRMFIFDGVQLKWECLTTHGSEVSPTSSRTRHDIDLKYIRGSLAYDTEHFPNTPAMERQFVQSKVWTRTEQQCWCDLVMHYTHRRMTKPSDRLVALAGIAQALNRKISNEYLAGLWLNHFFLGILRSLPHNGTSYINPSANFDVEHDRQIRHEQKLAPS